MIYKSKLAVLKFNLGTLVDIKAQTGKDALSGLQDEKDVADQITFVKAIFEAGCRSNKVEIPEGFDDLSFQDLADILNAFAKAYSVPGEVNPDTQPGQTASY